MKEGSPEAKIVDVNINRLQESLKVIEDIVRFKIDNLSLLERVRSLRQEVTRLIKRIDYPRLVRARRSSLDPGRRLDFDVKKGGGEVLIRNFFRAKEASRILEEMMDPEWKQIRFQIYDLEHLLLSPRAWFDPSFYLIWDERYFRPRGYHRELDTMIKSGVTMIQLRFKRIPDRDYLKLLKSLRRRIPKPIAMIVNDRADLALAAGADGVHLGESDLPVEEVRKMGGEGFIIGRTIRETTEIEKIEGYVDYFGVGSIFPSPTKPEARVIGIKGLKRIVRKSDRPIVAIGGITPKEIPVLFAAGVAGVALSSYLFEGNLDRRLREVAKAIRSSSGSRGEGRTSSAS